MRIFPTARRKLLVAMSAYAVLGIVAGFNLDGFLRLVVLLLLALLAIKTMTHSKDEPMP